MQRILKSTSFARAQRETGNKRDTGNNSVNICKQPAQRQALQNSEYVPTTTFEKKVRTTWNTKG